MLHVTQQAATELRALLKDTRAPDGQALKLVPDGKGSLGMTVGPANATDMIVRDSGQLVLIVAAEVVPLLDGLVFDLIKTTVDDRATTEFTLRELTDTEPGLLAAEPPTS